MNTEKEYKSEELNESELDNVAGGASDDGRMPTPEEQEEQERLDDEAREAEHEGRNSDDGRV